MKNLFKLFIVLFCCAAAMSLTSCLNSENDSLDSETAKQYMTNMSGPYYGKMRFYKYNEGNATSATTVQYDSIMSLSWTMGADSIIKSSYGSIINCLDSAIIVKEDDTKYKSLAEALRDYAGTATLTGAYWIPSQSAISSSGINFNAQMSVSAKLNYDGADHYVYFIFTQQTGYYAGIWTTTRQLQIQQVLYCVYISDKAVTNFNGLEPLSSSYVRPIGILLSTI